MKLFISDIHIGNPLFKKKKELIELLSDPSIEEIYILGDVIDSWEGNVDGIVYKNKELINFINYCDKVVLILKGNHDPDIAKLKEIFYRKLVLTEFRMELDGKEALLVHGDMCDTSQWWARTLYPIQFVFERLGCNFGSFFRNLYHRLLMLLTTAKYNSLILKMEIDLVDELEDECDILIAGHTHLHKDVALSNIRYINCGCLVRNPTYVTIDRGIVRIRRL